MLSTIGRALVRRICLQKIDTDNKKYTEGSPKGFEDLEIQAKKVNE
jgi:hypothetical protein